MILTLLREIFISLLERIQSHHFRRNFAPRINGDGHPVLLISGFMANDFMMKPMHKFLRRIGYTSYAWGLGRNMANLENVDSLSKRLERLHQQHKVKVSVIGWSLGGIYARELSKRKPEMVRHVITLSSPFGNIEEKGLAAIAFQIIKGKSVENVWDKNWINTLPEPTPVLTTSIYSKKDSVISWRNCVDQEEDTLHKNIEAQSTHMGMPYNKTSLKIVADRLPIKS